MEMKRHKAIFGEVRETIGNHLDKALARYYQQQEHLQTKPLHEQNKKG
jgi:hypothetical protein